MPKNNSTNTTRRNFIRQLTGTGIAIGVGSLGSIASAEKIDENTLLYQKKITINDRINIAVIGLGIMGFNNVNTALKIPGVQLVAACDLYSGRLQRVRELYGKEIFTTNDYRKILDRKEVDAVIIATSDHWHARITSAALKSGKHVYCEKPMVHFISEGLGVIAAQKASNKTLQIGSQRVSSLLYQKARELYLSGEIGKLNMVNAIYHRQSAQGAWEYTMPTDESAQTVDWERYIAGMPAQPYDAKKFFWWRNYKEFGTGVAGDLFVHLLSGTHVITNSMGPISIYSSGQLCYWKDGRNVPDIMTGILHYPATDAHAAFELSLQVNFVSGTGGTETIRFIGDEGTIDIDGDGLTVHHSKMTAAPGIGGWDALATYPLAMQETLKNNYNQKYTAAQQRADNKKDIVYKLPKDYNEHLEHHANFFESVRTGKPVVENAEFGFRAAAPCLACNESYFSKKIIGWDPVAMKKIVI